MSRSSKAAAAVLALAVFTAPGAWEEAKLAHADYSDTRDFDTSKAKSALKAIRKDFAALDEAIGDPKRLKNGSFFANRAKSIERNLERAAENDPSWDLRKEKAYYADITKRWQAAVATANRAAIEEAEPDVGDWDIPAFAGAPKISVVAPTWCAGAEVADKDGFIRRYEDLALNFDDDSQARAAQHACRAPNFKKRQAWIRVWRQALANRTGADMKLSEDYYKLAVTHLGRYGSSELRDETCTEYGYDAKNRGKERDTSSRTRSRAPKARAVSTGSIGQRVDSGSAAAFKRATAIGLGCEGNTVNLDRGTSIVPMFAWWIDGQAEPPSELVRAVFILQTIGLTLNEESLAGDRWKEEALKTLGNYALVAADIQKLDKSKFERELQAMGLNAWGSVMARMTFARAQQMGRIYGAAYKSMDGGIQELAFQAPVKAFANWTDLANANKAGLELARKVEDSFTSKQTQDIRDCHAKAHAFLANYIKSKKPKVDSEEDRKAMLDDPIASVLLQTSMTCAAYEGKLGVAANLYKAGLENVRTHRGPRFASYYAMLERFSELKEKDPSLPLEDSQVGFWVDSPNPSMAYGAYEQTFNKTGVVMDRAGRIKTASKAGNAVKLTFATESWQEPSWDCKETRKIDRITSDGRILYRLKCKQTGMKTVTSTVEPYEVPASLAAGLAPGLFLRAKVEFTKSGNIGTPLVLYTSKKQDKVLAVLGLEP